MRHDPSAAKRSPISQRRPRRPSGPLLPVSKGCLSDEATEERVGFEPGGRSMELFAVYGRSPAQPADWAEKREREGWDGVAVPDHILSSGVGWPHPFFVLGLMAGATGQLTLTLAVANNLVRSPVEFAQLCSTAQAMSAGRYEAGFGAGWARDEIVGIGFDYPEPAARARRFKEAVLVLRECLTNGGCQFDGEFYSIDIPVSGPPVADPPPIAAALGGPWTVANIGPLVDHIEVIAGRALSKGHLDFEVMAAVTTEQLHTLVQRARDANPSATVGTGLYVAAGDGLEVETMATAFPETSVYSGLAGPPEVVADRIQELGERLGLDRITVVPGTHGSIESVSPRLFPN